MQIRETIMPTVFLILSIIALSNSLDLIEDKEGGNLFDDDLDKKNVNLKRFLDEKLGLEYMATPIPLIYKTILKIKETDDYRKTGIELLDHIEKILKQLPGRYYIVEFIEDQKKYLNSLLINFQETKTQLQAIGNRYEHLKKTVFELNIERAKSTLVDFGYSKKSPKNNLKQDFRVLNEEYSTIVNNFRNFINNLSKKIELAGHRSTTLGLDCHMTVKKQLIVMQDPYAIDGACFGFRELEIIMKEIDSSLKEAIAVLPPVLADPSDTFEEFTMNFTLN